LRNSALKQSDFAYLSTSKKQDARSEALYSFGEQVSKQVLIECKEYDWQKDSGPLPIVLDPVRRLATLLGAPDQFKPFRILNCIGYLDKTELPEHRKNAEAGASSSEVHATDEDELISLLELFNWVKKTSLTDCIALVKSIATNLYYLHTVDSSQRTSQREHFAFAGFELHLPVRSYLHDGVRIF
jgi:hypothetical protein